MDLKSHHTRRKAISGILSGLIFFAMLFTAGMSLVLFTFTSFNNQNQAQSLANQAAQAKSAESLSLRSCDGTNNPLPSVTPWSPVKCTVGAGDVGVWVQNDGSVPVTLKGLWVLDSKTNSIAVGFSPIVNPSSPISPCWPNTINPGGILSCSGTAQVIDTGFKPGASLDQFSVTFITNSGNQFSASYPPPPLPNALPTITLSPNSGPSGTTVTISGSNFAPSSTPVTIKFGGSVVTTVPSPVATNSGGTFSATFVVPALAAGAYAVSATDATSNAASAVFTITTPSITLSPNGGPFGVLVTVTVTGSGFSPSPNAVTVAIKLDGTTQVTIPASVTTSPSGAFSATFDVGTTVPVGPHTVQASDANGLSATAIYTVTSSTLTTSPTITMNPTVGPIGTVVTIVGSNFGISKTVVVSFDGIARTTIPSPVISSPTGTFSATFVVPNTVAGPHTVGATDGINTASSVFTVTLPSISVAPGSALDGATITITGSYFASSSNVVIKFDAGVVATTPPLVTTSTAGSFGSSSSVTFNVPDGSTAGLHTVTATDTSGNTASTIFTVSAAQIALNPLSGINGASVTVTGSGFIPSSSVAIKFDGSATGMPSCSSDVSGNINSGCIFVVPALASTGVHIVSAADVHLNTATATFTVSCSSQSLCVSASAFGIGYISFNFNTYDFYTLSGGSCIATIGNYPSGTCNLVNQGLAYSIPHEGPSTYLVFSVSLTNVDPNQRDILFDTNNFMQAVMICASPAGGSCGSLGGASAIWSMGCASGGVVQPVASCQVTENGVTGIPLHYGQATTIYFIADLLGTPPQITNKWGTNFYAISPIFFLVHGSLACLATSSGCVVGTAQGFGENIPFTSVYFTP